MTLAEAIRRGCAYHKEQCQRIFFRTEGRKTIASCVLGAALRGAEPRKKKFVLSYKKWQDMLIRFPEVSQKSWCPECRQPNDLSAVMGHLNDDHRWTREEIANWVENVKS